MVVEGGWRGAAAREQRQGQAAGQQATHRQGRSQQVPALAASGASLCLLLHYGHLLLRFLRFHDAVPHNQVATAHL